LQKNPTIQNREFHHSLFYRGLPWKCLINSCSEREHGLKSLRLNS